jgi:hypothetical protein
MGIIYALLHQGVIAVTEQDGARAAELGCEALRLARSCEFETMIGHSIELLAAAAILRDQPARGTRLFGAASRIFNELGHKMQPAERARTEYWVQVAHSRLDAAAFATAWAEGYALPREALVVEALELPLAERSLPLQ